MVRLRQSLEGVLLPGLMLVAIAVGGCRQLPQRPGESVEILQQGELAALNPNDIVVMPIVKIAGGDVPDRALRSAFAEALLRRQYVPLSLDEVDKRVVNASYTPGYMNEDAVLEIVIHQWDDGQIETNGNLKVGIEARMLGVGKANAPALWAAKLTKTYNIASYQETLVTHTASMKALCREMAWDLIVVMEKRDTSALRD